MRPPIIYTNVGDFSRYYYEKQIDFGHSAKVNKFQIMTFLPIEVEDAFTQSLYNLGALFAFAMDCATLKSNRTIKVTFDSNSNTRSFYRRDLLRHIAKCGNKIIWKEGGYGYEITESGDVIRRWQLAPKQLALPPALIDSVDI